MEVSEFALFSSYGYRFAYTLKAIADSSELSV